jgi:hypothetical protein
LADQPGHVRGVEPDGGTEVHGGEFASLDETLHGARVHVEQTGSLARSEE